MLLMQPLRNTYILWVGFRGGGDGRERGGGGYRYVGNRAGLRGGGALCCG